MLTMTVNKCGSPHTQWTVLTLFTANVSVELRFLEVVRCIVNISCIWSWFCPTGLLCLYFCGRKTFKAQEGQKPQPRRSNAVDDEADKENINLLNFSEVLHQSCMILNVWKFLTMFWVYSSDSCNKCNYLCLWDQLAGDTILLPVLRTYCI